jgi:hypothetical protein
MRLTRVCAFTVSLAASVAALAATDDAVAPLKSKELSIPAVCGAAPPPADAAVRTIGELSWHTDYSAAFRDAEAQHRMLLVFFRDEERPAASDKFEKNVLSNKQLNDELIEYVRLVLPLSAEKPYRIPESAGRLIDEPSFAHMHRRAGIAIIDMMDRKDKLLFGQVVSAHPFGTSLSETLHGTQAVLRLPRGTLTQRTLTFAVRMHPAGPQSAFGRCNAFLCSQCTVSSRLMSQYGSVGHHDWGNRSAQIGSALGRSPSEVAAMSGNGSVVDAAFEIVNQWAGSPTHWGMVASPSAMFGYDMVQGPGGWYGTGLFVN